MKSFVCEREPPPLKTLVIFDKLLSLLFTYYIFKIYLYDRYYIYSMHFTLEIKCVTANVMCMEDNKESCDYIVLSLTPVIATVKQKTKTKQRKKTILYIRRVQANWYIYKYTYSWLYIIINIIPQCACVHFFFPLLMIWNNNSIRKIVFFLNLKAF